MAVLKTSSAALVLGGVVLAACVKPEPPKDYMLTCLHETGAKGSYLRSFEKIGPNGLPLVIPAAGGDARGAVLMNACIEEHHREAGTLPNPAGPTPPKMMSNGKLSVPQGYDLSPEDVALWKTLTLEQQKRAYEFLKSGSTIQSSLLED
ncbi:hypothetical protein [Profundibacter sp.]